MYACCFLPQLHAERTAWFASQHSKTRPKQKLAAALSPGTNVLKINKNQPQSDRENPWLN